jgi:hypothetical protein
MAKEAASRYPHGEVASVAIKRTNKASEGAAVLSLHRVIGIAIVILALVIAIVPSLYNCAARDIYMYVTGMDAMGGATDDGTAISPDEMMTGTTMAGGMSATSTTVAGMGTATTGGMGGSTGTTMAGGAAPGSTMEPTSKGMKVPMKCFYSAKAAILVAIPIAILGLLLVVSRRKETGRALAILGVALGGITMAVPVVVGTCGSASAICNEVLKPTMLLAGGSVAVLSVVVLVLGGRRQGTAA